MHLIGIEPTHAAPEATALSTELQTHPHNNTIFSQKLQALFLSLFFIILPKIRLYNNRCIYARYIQLQLLLLSRFQSNEINFYCSPTFSPTRLAFIALPLSLHRFCDILHQSWLRLTLCPRKTLPHTTPVLQAFPIH